MKKKIKSIWWEIQICWDYTLMWVLLGLSIATFMLGSLGTAIVYKTNPDFSSSTWFVLSIIAIVLVTPILLFCAFLAALNLIPDTDS